MRRIEFGILMFWWQYLNLYEFIYKLLLRVYFYRDRGYKVLDPINFYARLGRAIINEFMNS